MWRRLLIVLFFSSKNFYSWLVLKVLKGCKPKIKKFGNFKKKKIKNKNKYLPAFFLEGRVWQLKLVDCDSLTPEMSGMPFKVASFDALSISLEVSMQVAPVQEKTPTSSTVCLLA